MKESNRFNFLLICLFNVSFFGFNYLNITILFRIVLLFLGISVYWLSVGGLELITAEPDYRKLGRKT